MTEAILMLLPFVPNICFHAAIAASSVEYKGSCQYRDPPVLGTHNSHTPPSPTSISLMDLLHHCGTLVGAFKHGFDEAQHHSYDETHHDLDSDKSSMHKSHYAVRVSTVFHESAAFMCVIPSHSFVFRRSTKKFTSIGYLPVQTVRLLMSHRRSISSLFPAYRQETALLRASHA